MCPVGGAESRQRQKGREGRREEGKEKEFTAQKETERVSEWVSERASFWTLNSCQAFLSSVSSLSSLLPQLGLLPHNAAALRLPNVSVSSSRWTYFHTPGVCSGSSAEDELPRCAWSCSMDQTLALNSVSKNQSVSHCVCGHLVVMSGCLPACCFPLLHRIGYSLHPEGSCRSLAAHTEVSLLARVVFQRNVVTNDSQTLMGCLTLTHTLHCCVRRTPEMLLLKSFRSPARDQLI